MNLRPASSAVTCSAVKKASALSDNSVLTAAAVMTTRLKNLIAIIMRRKVRENTQLCQ